MDRESSSYFIGVDVGTSSVRSALVTSKGEICEKFVESICDSNPSPNHYEQDSGEIWKAVCHTVRQVTSKIDDKSKIKGIGFDATCSLVVLGESFEPISVSASEESRFENDNIIMWMDHRAQLETDLINSKNHEVLQYVGGKISVEMEIPKLMWLKKNYPERWAKAKHFFDLPDFLTFKATGSLSRSLCSIVCKWTYISKDGDQHWDTSFLKDVGLEDLCKNDCAKIGSVVLPPGSFCGTLTSKAAEEMGLSVETRVGTSLIDAHAGALALMSSRSLTLHNVEPSLFGRLALICGTSSCHICLSKERIDVAGIWGPYYGAVVESSWCAEGGQSATGRLIDHIIEGHPSRKLVADDVNIHEFLEKRLEKMVEARKLEHMAVMTQFFHVYPDFHGNRSPLANSSLAGMVCGLSFDNSIDNLALVYLAAIQAIVYGTKDIIDQLSKNGHQINSVFMCGGLSKSKIFIQTHADALGLNVYIANEKESVLLGAAMLGACAARPAGHLGPVALSMGSDCDSYQPNADLFGFHKQKYKVFKKMQQDQLEYRQIMSD